MRITRALMLVGVLLTLGAIAPSTASAQCYSPGYGGGYYGNYYTGYYSYPVYRHVHHYPRYHNHSYYRRRFWR